MFSLRSITRSSSTFTRRFLSTEATSVATSPQVKVVKGSTFMERFSSFLIGLGVGSAVCYYNLILELKLSNEELSKKIDAVLGKN